MADEAILFPDAVAVVVDYLAAGLASAGDAAHVGSRTRTDRWVAVSLVDSENVNLVVQRSTLRVEVGTGDGATSQQDSQDLAQLCRAVIGSMAGTSQGGTTVYKVTDLNMADDPDAVAQRNRYTFHVAISMRGVASSTDDFDFVLTDEFGQPIFVV